MLTYDGFIHFVLKWIDNLSSVFTAFISNTASIYRCNPQKQKRFGVPNNFSMCKRVLRPKCLRTAILHYSCLKKRYPG